MLSNQYYALRESDIALKECIFTQAESALLTPAIVEVQRNHPNKRVDGLKTHGIRTRPTTLKTVLMDNLKPLYGYKAHINVEENGFIKTTNFTTDNVHDSNLFHRIIMQGRNTGVCRQCVS